MFGDGAAYDPETRSWTVMPASPLSARLNTYAVWTGGEAIFWGGSNGSPLMDGATYEPSSRTWDMLPPAPLKADPQIGQAIVWTGTQMVVIEGEQASAFDPATRSWSPVPALPQVAGWQPGGIWAAWSGSEVIAWVASQSQAGNTTTGHESAYAWAPGSSAWKALPATAAYGWPDGTPAAIGGRVLLLGPGNGCLPGASCGGSGDYFPGYWFDPSSATWTELPETFSGGGGPAIWTGSAMVVFNTKAGRGPSTGPPDIPAGSAAAFDPSTGSWTDLARCPVTDFSYASVVWTGRQLIVVKMGSVSGGTAEVQVLS